MANKQTIYIVSNETNEVIRKSRTFLAAIQHTASLAVDSFYLCTSEFDLKKGDVMSNIVDFIDV